MKKLTLVLIALASSCQQTVNQAPDRDTTVRARPPIQVTWNEVARSGDGAIVELQVVRVLPMDLPFVVQIDVPAGVTVSKGRTKFVLGPNATEGTVSERLSLSFSSRPTDDLVAHVDGETGSMGYHAKVPYRFGRAKPEEQPPAATGPGLKLNGKSLGPSIPLN